MSIQLEMLHVDYRRIRGEMTGVFKYFYGCPQEVFKFIFIAARVELEATGTSSTKVVSGSK